MTTRSAPKNTSFVAPLTCGNGVHVRQVVLVRRAARPERVSRKKVPVRLRSGARIRRRVTGTAARDVDRQRVHLEAGVRDRAVRRGGRGECRRRWGRRVAVEVAIVEEAAGAGSAVVAAGCRQGATVGPVIGAGAVLDDVAVELDEARWCRQRDADRHRGDHERRARGCKHPASSGACPVDGLTRVDHVRYASLRGLPRLARRSGNWIEGPVDGYLPQVDNNNQPARSFVSGCSFRDLVARRRMTAGERAAPYAGARRTE